MKSLNKSSQQEILRLVNKLLFLYKKTKIKPPFYQDGYSKHEYCLKLICEITAPTGRFTLESIKNHICYSSRTIDANIKRNNATKQIQKQYSKYIPKEKNSELTNFS